MLQIDCVIDLPWSTFRNDEKLQLQKARTDVATAARAKDVEVNTNKQMSEESVIFIRAIGLDTRHWICDIRVTRTYSYFFYYIFTLF